MTLLAPALQTFFTERLITQRNASPQTIAAYRDTFRLLLAFARSQTGKQPFELDIDDLDAPLIGAFLNHLEQDRGNSPKTRNARLGAIHSFYRYIALNHPEHAHTIARVMAIPTKRYERNTVSYLDRDEIAALLAAPEPLSEDELVRAAELVEAAGGKSWAETKAGAALESAVSYLAETEMPNDVRAEFEGIAEFVTARQW